MECFISGVSWWCGSVLYKFDKQNWLHHCNELFVLLHQIWKRTVFVQALRKGQGGGFGGELFPSPTTLCFIVSILMAYS